jgi:hypothetical protein
MSLARWCKSLSNKTMFSRFPFDRVDWLVSSFLIGTLFLSLTAVPLYLYFFGIDWFQVALFFVMLFACGFSITLGYHRLFSHLTFKAHWTVRLFTVIFGAGAFENSVLLWACEHRSHHKHVDHDDDPYSISKGLFYAHIGWLMFKLKPKKGPAPGLAGSIHSFACRNGSVRTTCDHRLCLGRLESGARRVLDRRSPASRRAATRHFLYQFTLSLHRQPTVLLEMQRPGFMASGYHHDGGRVS